MRVLMSRSHRESEDHLTWTTTSVGRIHPKSNRALAGRCNAPENYDDTSHAYRLIAYRAVLLGTQWFG